MEMWAVLPAEISCPDLSHVTEVTVTGELTESPVGMLNMAGEHGNVAGGIGDLAARGDKAGNFQIGRMLRAGDGVVEDQRRVGRLRRRGIVVRYAAVIERESRRAGDDQRASLKVSWNCTSVPVATLPKGCEIAAASNVGPALVGGSKKYAR